MGVIQQSVNQGISTIGFLATQSPTWQNMMQKSQLKGQLQKSNKADEKAFKTIFPKDAAIENDEGGVEFHKYYKMTEPLRNIREKQAEHLAGLDPLNKEAFNTRTNVEQERLMEEEYNPIDNAVANTSTQKEVAAMRKSYIAPAMELVRTRGQQQTNLEQMIKYAKRLRQGVIANGQDATNSR